MISLIHPSYGRPELARKAHDEWFEKSNNWDDIDYWLSLDYRDDTQAYKKAFKGTSVNIIMYSNNNCVQATNIAAEQTEGDILVYLSDDFGCPKGWDTYINTRLNTELPQLLKVNDGLQTMRAAVLTIPIMTRKLYETLGYFWCPDYESMWVDVDLFYQCTKMGCILIAPEAIFQHRHYSSGASDHDTTYAQHDNKERGDRGKEIFRKRKKTFGW